MKYNPQIHHRRSIRLKGYDYSQAGAYFITICVKDKKCLFGHVENKKMILNDAGIMIDKWWQKIPEKFPDIELDVYQIMPNHFHAIIINTGAGVVRANPCVRPDTNIQTDTISNMDPEIDTNNTIAPNTGQTHGSDSESTPDTASGQTHGAAPSGGDATILGEHDDALGEHLGSPLHRIVQWFKTMSTNEYIRGVKSLNWAPFNGKLFQRNYYEHIIRNERAYHNISNYIINNPAKWDDDKFFLK